MSRIIKIQVQLKGDKKPKQHFALVFDDIITLADFMIYRNALNTAVKSMLSSEHGEKYQDECFRLLQISGFINSALDVELYWKGGVCNG